MEQRELTSDDLESLPGMNQPITRRDYVRFLRSALEKNPEPTIEKTMRLLLHVVLEDSGFGATLRGELAQELHLASPLELVVMREALLRVRTPMTDRPAGQGPSGTNDETP
jgi:hypothetical protein